MSTWGENELAKNDATVRFLLILLASVSIFGLALFVIATCGKN